MNKNILYTFLLFFVGSIVFGQQTFRVDNFDHDLIPLGLNDKTTGFMIYEIEEDDKYDYIVYSIFNEKLTLKSNGRIKVDFGTEIMQIVSNETHFCFTLKNVIKENFKILVFNREGQNVGKKTYSKRRNKNIKKMLDNNALTPKVAAGKEGFYLIQYDGNFKKGYEVRKVNNQLQRIWKSYNYHKGEGIQAFVKLVEDNDDVLIYNVLIHEADDVLLRYEIDIMDGITGDYKEDIFLVHQNYSLVPNTMLTEKNGDRIFGGIYYEGSRIRDKIADGVFIAKVKKDRREFDEQNDRVFEKIDRRASNFKFVEIVNYEESLRKTAFNAQGEAYDIRSRVRFFVPKIYKKANEYKAVVETFKLEDDKYNLAIKSDNQWVAYFETLKQRKANWTDDFELEEDEYNESVKKKEAKEQAKEEKQKQATEEKTETNAKKAEKAKEKEAEELVKAEKAKEKAAKKEEADKIKQVLKKGDRGKKNNEAQQQKKKKIKLKDNSKVEEAIHKVKKSKKDKKAEDQIEAIETDVSTKIDENAVVQKSSEDLKDRKESRIKISRIEEYKPEHLLADFEKGYTKNAELLDFYSLTFQADTGALSGLSFIKKQHESIAVDQTVFAIGNLAFLANQPDFLTFRTSSKSNDRNQYFVYEELVEDDYIYKLADLNDENVVTSQLIKNRVSEFAKNLKSGFRKFDDNRLMFYTFDNRSDKYIYWTEALVANRKINEMKTQLAKIEKRKIAEKKMVVAEKKEYDELEELDEEQLKTELRILELKKQLRERLGTVPE